MFQIISCMVIFHVCLFNGFSGSIPDQLFDSTSLTNFIAGQNCFTGTISDAICDATTLTLLDLSGISAGNRCSVHVKNAFASYIINNQVFGTLPSCLFNMKAMESLYLSSNGLVTKLYDIPPTSNLEVISISNNRLYGTIPLSIQTAAKLQLLDLSYNYLSGSIDNMNHYKLETGECTVNLESNRLSGLLPNTFTYASSINVLDGNIFGCSNADTLPHNDPYYSKYTCGSDTLNDYIFLNLFFILILIS